jgi:hypothetical protein
MIFRRSLAAVAALALCAVHAIAAAPAFVHERIAMPAASLFRLGLDLLLGLFTPIDDGRRLRFVGPSPSHSGGEPLAPALLNSLRHEAGMRPLRC